ncbi:hypothetical protein Godav_022351 [Gossypium davidsonii]|uniref:Uncharacterized protein n=2 Tax=Gossypium TaxID=3633 RepID=A0A7J8TKU3_GOSDV|nr:hypothetical protein [Gossypium davidsonii]MBA0669975.1 hypothetical protein [Gossypium klotzschianum]
MDDDTGPSTRPKHSPGPSSAAIQSPGPARALTQSPDPAVQPTMPTAQPFQMMPGAYPNSFIGPTMYMPAPHERSQEGPSGSYSFYQSPSPYEFQTASPFVMQTPPQSLFYQCGSSSQH